MNVVFFIQRFQSLVIFWVAVFVKINIATSFQGFALEWYISELNNFDRNALDNKLGKKS